VIDAAEAYFAEARERFARAAAAGSTETALAIAGRRVRLVFAGSGLPPTVLPALGHLVEPAAGGADLVVELWDTASTGVPMLPPPRGHEALPPGGHLEGWQGERHVTFQGGPGGCTLFDREAGRALVWARDARAIEPFEQAAPLRRLLAVWLEPLGITLVHAAAVGGARGGLLLGGRGGSGKSTTALLCLAAGMGFAGDDYVALDGDGFAHGLYATAKVDAASLERFPALRAHFSGPPPPGEKAIAYLHPHPALGRGFPVRGVLMARAGARETRLAPITPGAALRGIAPSSLLQLPRSTGSPLAAIARLVERVPCHAIELGPDASAIVSTVAGLLA
jgi:hypothetical protein